MWTYDGTKRPDIAAAPGPGQESVWDYPRPPRIEAERRPVRVAATADQDTSGDGTTTGTATCTMEIALSERALRVIETASPPTVYLPREDIVCPVHELDPHRHASFCEWKGRAHYLALGDPDGASSASPPVAWFYPDPTPAFESIRGFVAFYPSRVACYLADERVRSQPGGFYGGWITDEIVGPWKGDPGSGGW